MTNDPINIQYVVIKNLKALDDTYFRFSHWMIARNFVDFIHKILPIDDNDIELQHNMETLYDRIDEFL